MLFLSDSDVAQLLPIKDVIALMHRGFSSFVSDEWEIPQRTVVSLVLADRELITMPVYSRVLQRTYAKIVVANAAGDAGSAGRASALCCVWDISGSVLLVAEATTATALRTAGTVAVAARLLARPDSRVVALIGAGYQGWYQLMAVAAVFPIQSVLVFDQNGVSMERLMRRAANSLGIATTCSPCAETAVSAADIVLAATNSKNPVFCGECLRSGTHVSSIGSYRSDMRELDETTLARSRVVVDALGHTPRESGDLVEAIGKGVVRLSDVVDLSAVLQKPALGRRSSDEITVFKSAGFALEDAFLLEGLWRASTMAKNGKDMKSTGVEA